MANSLPSFVLGYHGCDKKTADAVVSGKEADLLVSENLHDWLGHGIYFWENDPQRALEWARQRAAGNHQGSTVIETPAVVGAIIDLGHCLSLVERSSVELLEKVHKVFRSSMEEGGNPMPENTAGKDRLRRALDCSVVNLTHLIQEKTSSLPFDSVRALFSEGEPIYPTSGFMKRSHLQICVRNKDCIKGYFHLRSHTSEGLTDKL